MKVHRSTRVVVQRLLERIARDGVGGIPAEAYSKFERGRLSRVTGGRIVDFAVRLLEHRVARYGAKRRRR